MLGNDPSDLFFPSNIILVEGKSDEVFLRRVYELLIVAGQSLKKNIAFHYCGGYDKAEYAVEAVVQMLKTQGYMPIYKDRICGLFDKPTQNTKLVSEIRQFVSDTASDKFILLDKDAIEYYFPLEAVRKTLGDATINQAQLELETTKFLQQYKSQGQGNYFTFQNIKKVDLATRISLNIDTIIGLDQRIIDLIKKCVSLSF